MDVAAHIDAASQAIPHARESTLHVFDTPRVVLGADAVLGDVNRYCRAFGRIA